MSAIGAEEWFFGARGQKIQPIYANRRHSHVGSGVISSNLDFVVPPSATRTIIICASTEDADLRILTGINWGAGFVLERDSEFGLFGDGRLVSQIWKASVPAVYGSSADLSITVSTGTIDRLALTIFATDIIDSITAVDDGEDEGRNVARNMSNIATTADGFAIGAVAMRSGSSVVNSFNGNASTGALADAGQSEAGGLSHAAFFGPTPATDTVEDFTVLLDVGADTACTIATYK